MRATIRNHRAFTLVELMIVVMIIGIMGVASMNGFSRLGDLQDGRVTQSIVANALADLDTDLYNYELSSYDIIISSDSLGYVVRSDFYGKTDLMTLQSFNFASGIGVIATNSTSTGILSFGWSHVTNLLAASGAVIPLVLTGDSITTRYDFTSSIEWTRSNGFSFQYYNAENLGGPEQKQVRLTSIKSGTVLYDSLTIRNILGKKEMTASGVTIDPLESVTLTFEKNGKETTLQVKK